jgi:transcription-repair coupling factor (superfamily II helicase)
VPATTALYRVAPPSFLAGYTFSFQVKQKLEEAKLKAQLTLAGYNHVTQVVSPGEYAVRGGLIDLFPMGSAVPYRVDLFDDEIDSIRTFDPDTSAACTPCPRCACCPGREFPMDDDARAKFRSRWRELMEGDPTKSRIYKDMGNGVATAGIEYYLPLFFEETATVFDYLGEQATLVLHGDLEPAFLRFWQDTKDRYRLLQGDPERPILPPEALFLTTEQFYGRANDHAQLSLRPGTQDVADSALFQKLPDLSVVRGAEEPLARLRQHVAATAHRVLVVAESAGRRESLLDFLRASQVSPPAFESLEEFEASDEKIGIATAALAEGFSWVEAGLDIVTETELFASRRHHAAAQEAGAGQRRRVADQGPVGAERRRPGGPHAARHRPLQGPGQHGPGPGQHRVPAPRIRRQRHALRARQPAAPDQPLHRRVGRRGAAAQAGLGPVGEGRRKAAEQVRDTAAELLNIYARRAAREGFAFRYSPQDYEQFANDFGFEETADQNAAIHAVIQDMISPQPMDRLVCGDVGFGKTEVALRAAFIAVTGGKQVAFLAPTTLLAEQHYQTLVDRFSKWPVKVAEVSRFRSGKEVTATLKGLADGSVDIVVGTHKLLSESTKFKNLGLLIIDEEHRFGVRHKEAMKAMRAEVDVLTLTATPIPRTLGMALEGLRDLSVIATAPQRRLAIKTFVRNEGNGVVREAVLRELKRGGQVYFLHNEVETIENRRQRLEELLPEARIAVAHGQMPERELEKVMRDFVGSASTCCCAPPSSRPASTCRPPTPSSSAGPTSSAWRSCTSCAAASAAATTRPMPT